LKNFVTIKSRLEVTHPANVCTVCTSLKSIVPPLHSLIYTTKSREFVRHGRLNSLKVIESPYAIYYYSTPP